MYSHINRPRLQQTAVAVFARSAERVTAEWEVSGSIPEAGPHTQGLKITEK